MTRWLGADRILGQRSSVVSDMAQIESFPAAYPHWESRAGSALGLNRDELRYLRGKHLAEGLDWAVVNRRICLTVGAVKKLREAVQQAAGAPIMPEGGEVSPDEETGLVGAMTEALPTEEPALPAKALFVVWRERFMNDQVIECFPFGTDGREASNRVLVRVKTAKNFARVHARTGEPFLVECRNEDGKWVAVRCPRFKGVW